MSEQITDLLMEWSGGSNEALDRRLPMVEAELRRIAGNYMRHERPDHTLQTTALVNEAYLKRTRPPKKKRDTNDRISDWRDA